MDRQAAQGHEFLSRLVDLAMHETREPEIKACVRPAGLFCDDIIERRHGGAPRAQAKARNSEADPGIETTRISGERFSEIPGRIVRATFVKRSLAASEGRRTSSERQRHQRERRHRVHWATQGAPPARPSSPAPPS